MFSAGRYILFSQRKFHNIRYHDQMIKEDVLRYSMGHPILGAMVGGPPGWASSSFICTICPDLFFCINFVFQTARIFALFSPI